MNEKLLIIGAGGHGKVISDIALSTKKWREINFLDDIFSKSNFGDASIIGKVADVENFLEDYDLFVGIGNNEIRNRLLKKLEELNASVATIIHPKAVIGSKVNIAKGTVVMAGVVINCNTTIGRGCIINTSSSIDHDNTLEDCVHISPGVHLAGNVKVGQGSWLGIGSIVSNNINIAQQCNVGAGTVVVRDITKSGLYVGVPARKIK